VEIPTAPCDIYLCLALTEEQLHTSLDEFRVCDEFKDYCSTVSCTQQVLRMVDGNDADCLPDCLQKSINVKPLWKGYINILRSEA
jgi:hypothetical protein